MGISRRHLKAWPNGRRKIDGWEPLVQPTSSNPDTEKNFNGQVIPVALSNNV